MINTYYTLGLITTNGFLPGVPSDRKLRRIHAEHRTYDLRLRSMRIPTQICRGHDPYSDDTGNRVLLSRGIAMCREAYVFPAGAVCSM